MKRNDIFFVILLLIVAPVSARTIGLTEKTLQNTEQTYDLTIPEEWEQEISVGELTVDCNAFYGVPWFLGLYPVVRLNLPVENLTADTLYLKLNYRTESKIEGYGNSGMGSYYMLEPCEKRLIDTIAPIASVTRPIRFILSMGRPHHHLESRPSAGTRVVIIDPFTISAATSGIIEQTNVDNKYFVVKEVQPAHSKEQGNLVVFKVQNTTDRDVMLRTYVAVNDPVNIETKGVLARPRGFFSDTIETISAKNVTSITIPYNIPPVGPDPVLVFTLFKPHKEDVKPNERDNRDWDMTLVGYGSIDLNRTAERGLCVIPIHESVEERAKLTVEKKSKHFLFRYRPDSYAEQHLDRAISEREAAYRRLSDVLKMDLPEIVTIDLYPDMEAKALGSGTTWTPANTRSNKHICEVYNEEYQCDPYHELAHIFSYHFANYSSNRGGIVESFAAYFEPNNMAVDVTKEILKRQLSEGKLSSLMEILQSDGSSRELVILIDFLLAEDVEKFKKFYVSVTRSQKKSDLEKTSRQIYGVDVKELEKQWCEFINRDNGVH
ncbi:MAG: hypothetical protein ACYSUX_08455 [Planctomycetota bacterium]|jgi:hypothetical protein